MQLMVLVTLEFLETDIIISKQLYLYVCVVAAAHCSKTDDTIAIKISRAPRGFHAKLCFSLLNKRDARADIYNNILLCSSKLFMNCIYILSIIML